MRPAGNPEVLQQRREHAIKLLKQGRQPVDVARVVGVDRRSVREPHGHCRDSCGRGVRGVGRAVIVLFADCHASPSIRSLAVGRRAILARRG